MDGSGVGQVRSHGAARRTSRGASSPSRMNAPVSRGSREDTGALLPSLPRTETWAPERAGSHHAAPLVPMGSVRRQSSAVAGNRPCRGPSRILAPLTDPLPRHSPPPVRGPGGGWYAREDSNLRLSDPKSDGAPSPESTQVTAAQGPCVDPGSSDEERLGVLLGVPAPCDRDLALLIAYWPQLPEQVRSTILTLVTVLRGREP